MDKNKVNSTKHGAQRPTYAHNLLHLAKKHTKKLMPLYSQLLEAHDKTRRNEFIPFYSTFSFARKYA